MEKKFWIFFLQISRTIWQHLASAIFSKSKQKLVLLILTTKQILVQKVKYSNRLSQETSCFSFVLFRFLFFFNILNWTRLNFDFLFSFMIFTTEEICDLTIEIQQNNFVHYATIVINWKYFFFNSCPIFLKYFDKAKSICTLSSGRRIYVNIIM